MAQKFTAPKHYFRGLTKTAGFFLLRTIFIITFCHSGYAAKHQRKGDIQRKKKSSNNPDINLLLNFPHPNGFPISPRFKNNNKKQPFTLMYMCQISLPFLLPPTEKEKGSMGRLAATTLSTRLLAHGPPFLHNYCKKNANKPRTHKKMLKKKKSK
uniref:Putative secreted protein n=1 Tax=Ixodes ricinus TaxID=34613 RepID=A0A6B0UWQ7_IXORI